VDVVWAEAGLLGYMAIRLEIVSGVELPSSPTRKGNGQPAEWIGDMIGKGSVLDSKATNLPKDFVGSW